MSTTCKTLNLNKMSKEKARVLIAKDVLARLRYRNVQTGYYLYDKNNVKHDIVMKASLDENDIDAQKYIVKLEKNCPACALGNMMLSHVRLFDQVTLDQLTGDREDITDVLEDYFDS